jgi:hypothetical protein
VESVVDVAAHATLESSLLSEFTGPFEDSMQMIARSSAGAGLACCLVALPTAKMPPVNTGLRARGGFKVDASWENGRLTRTAIRSRAGEPVNVRLGARTAKLQMKAGESLALDGELQASGRLCFSR